MATTHDSDVAARERIMQCRRCARVSVGETWLSEHDAVRELRTFERSKLPRFASALCPPCLAYVGIRPSATASVATAPQAGGS